MSVTRFKGEPLPFELRVENEKVYAALRDSYIATQTEQRGALRMGDVELGASYGAKCEEIKRDLVKIGADLSIDAQARTLVCLTCESERIEVLAKNRVACRGCGAKGLDPMAFRILSDLPSKATG